MRPFYKDMLIMALAQTGIVFNMIWGLLLPYYSSFVHTHNKDITVKKMFSTYTAFALGQFLAAKVMGKYYYIAGIKLGFLIIAILNLLNTYLQINCTSLFMVYVVMIFYGIALQSVITGCNLYVSESYENGILYAKYLTGIRITFYLIPLAVSQFMINPYNETATILSKNGEYFFNTHVTKNFSSFITLFGLYSSIVISLGYFCLKNTNQFRNRIAPFINSLMGKSQFRYNMDKEEIRIIQSISLTHQSLKFTKNFKSFIKQRNSNLLESFPTQKTIKSELNPEDEEKNNRQGVLVISLVCFILLTVYTYSIGMFKYIAIMFKLEDSTITLYYSLSTIFNVSGNFLAPYLWNKFPVIFCVLFLISCNFIALFIVLSSQFNPHNFLYSIWIERTQSGFQPMFADLICFGLFEPMEAIQQAQLFAYGNLFANLLGTIMNFILFSEKHWTLIFYVSLAMVIGACVYMFMNVKTILKITKKEIEQLINTYSILIMFKSVKFEGQEKIVGNLNLIDDFYNKDIDTKNKPTMDQTKKAIQDIYYWIEENIKTVSVNIFISLYEFLIYFDQQKPFDNLFNDFKLGYVLYGNLAYLIQSTWDYGSSSSSNKQNFQYIDNSIQIMQRQKLEYELDGQKHFFEIQKYNFCISKGYLQSAASYSQFKMHKKALQQGKKCLAYLKNLRLNLETLFYKNKKDKKIVAVIQQNRKLRKQFLNYLNFTKKVCKIFFKVLPSLVESDEQGLNFQYIKDLKSIQYNNTSQQQIDLQWLQEINIGNFVHVEFNYLEKVDLPVKLKDIYTEDFLGILIIFTAIVFFMLSTENRLLIMSQNNIENSQAFRIKSVFEKTHIQKIRKLKQFTFSQILHSKAIELLQCTIQKNILCDSLVRSFMNNFETGMEMEQIQEVDENAVVSQFESYLEYSFDHRKDYSINRDSCDQNYYMKQKKKNNNIIQENNCIPNKVESSLNNIQLKNQEIQNEHLKSLKNNILDKLFKKNKNHLVRQKGFKAKLFPIKTQMSKKANSRHVKTPNGRLVTIQKSKNIDKKFKKTNKANQNGVVKSTKFQKKITTQKKNTLHAQDIQCMLFQPLEVKLQKAYKKIPTEYQCFKKNKQYKKDKVRKMRSCEKVTQNKNKKRMSSQSDKNKLMSNIFRTYDKYQNSTKQAYSFQNKKKKINLSNLSANQLSFHHIQHFYRINYFFFTSFNNLSILNHFLYNIMCFFKVHNNIQFTNFFKITIQSLNQQMYKSIIHKFIIIILIYSNNKIQ